MVKVMGIVNVTPDSFYDGGRYLSAADAVRHAVRLIEEGADIIDIGGESTRPGAAGVPYQEEERRIMPVLKELAGRAVVSVDTQKSGIARQALIMGAAIVNDVSGLRADPHMAETAAEYNASVVIMHMKGRPENMQSAPYYDDVIAEIKDFFRERIAYAEACGVKREKIIIDPGIGFGKRVSDNLEILKRLGEFKEFGLPILIGPSRKSFIGGILGVKPEDRIWGTAAAVSAGIINGASIVRVHDVYYMRQAADVAGSIASPHSAVWAAGKI